MGVSRPPYRSSSLSLPRLRGNSDRQKAFFFESGSGTDPKTGEEYLFVDIIKGNSDLVDCVGFRFYPSGETRNVYQRRLVRLSDGTWARRFVAREREFHSWSKKYSIFVKGRGGTVRVRRLRVKPEEFRDRAVKFYEPRDLREHYREAPECDFGVEIETSLGEGTTSWDVTEAIRNRTGIRVLDESADYLRGTEDYSRWRLVPDASLACPIWDRHCTRLELVSRVLRGENGLRECEAVLEALGSVGRATCNKSMGLHVHVSVENMSLEGLKNVCLNFVKHEEAIDSFMPPSRNRSEYCRSNKKAIPADTDGQRHMAIINCHTLEELCSLLNPGDANGARYFKLNLQNLLGKGRKATKPTLEFRQHSSTTSFQKIGAWVRFCTSLVRHGASERPPKLGHHEDAFESLFDTVIRDLKLKSFYRGRREELRQKQEEAKKGHHDDNDNHHHRCGSGNGEACGRCRKGGACEQPGPLHDQRLGLLYHDQQYIRHYRI